MLDQLSFINQMVSQFCKFSYPSQQEHFLNQYNGFKSHGPVYFMDSTHPRHCPVMGYGWIKKGFDKFIKCNSGRAHLNINGAVNIKNFVDGSFSFFCVFSNNP